MSYFSAIDTSMECIKLGKKRVYSLLFHAFCELIGYFTTTNNQYGLDQIEIKLYSFEAI